MADNPQNNLNPKDLETINKYFKETIKDSQILADRLADVKNNAAEFERELKNAKEHFADLNIESVDLSKTFKNVIDDLLKLNNTSGLTNKSFKILGSLSDKLKYDALDLSRLSKKDLENIQKKTGIEIENLKTRKTELDLSVKRRFQNLSDEQIASIGARTKNKNTAQEIRQYIELNGIFKKNGDLQKDGNNYVQRLLDLTQERLIEEKGIINTLGISGKLVDGIIGSLGKLGISSDFFEGIKEDMREVAKSGNKFEVLMAGVNGLMSGIGQALKDPVAQLMLATKAFEFFLKAAVNANKESVNLSKNLGYSAENADRVRANFASIEENAGSLTSGLTATNVTTANLAEAFNQISESTGFVSEYSSDALITQIKLTKQLGLTGDEAAGVYKFSVLTGKSSEQTYQSMLKGYVATRNSLGAGVPFKAAMAKAAKVSGQLASNLGNNPETIIKAVVATKALGTSLEQAKSQGEKLLDFQSSIENELKAELITGQQLNLERARAAALMGDQVTVAEELASQGMTAAKFSGMNVIAQKSFAEALGTTSDELANQLAKREMAIASGKSLAQVTAEEAEEAAERQDIQEKFNAAMLKLQSIIGNLVAGPLGSFLELLSGALNIINSIATPLKYILGAYLAINAAKKIALGYDIASKAANQISANLGLAQIGTNRVKNLLEKESLLTKISGNIQLFYQLAAERGVMSALKTQFGIQQASTILKKEGLLLTMKDFIIEKGKLLFTNLQKVGLIAINALKVAGSIIEKRTAIVSIASAAMGAFKAAVSGIGAALGPLAIPIGIAAAAGVAALGYSFLQGDDVVSEGGYGKRTLLSPEGAIQLNNKDTVIAGTNLGGGSKIDSVRSSPAMDISPMISAINQVTAAVTTLNNKSWDVKLDSKSVGSGLMQNSYKSA